MGGALALREVRSEELGVRSEELGVRSSGRNRCAISLMEA